MLLTAILVFLTPRLLRADEPYWGLIVHGGNTTHTSYDNGILRVEFRHSQHPAGSPFNYERQVPRGQAAWPDRPLSPNEPSVLLQKMSEADASNIMEHLNSGGYWEFYCRNTGKGFFEVSNSKMVRSAVRFD